jgi:hypothetical protein
MKHWSSLLIFGTAILSSGALLAQASPAQKLEGPKTWKYCEIDSPLYKGRCSHTIISAGEGAIDIHFLRWPGKPEGLTFVFGGDSLPAINLQAFILVVESMPGKERVNQVPGRCSYSKSEISCVSYDGRFSAKASATQP